ncbi:MAG: hypothetical protein KAW02_03675 [candidate division Zixibacteria bacterium]|nr:hypothetical protein [candidate division Zixibacteria bacterium]
MKDFDKQQKNKPIFSGPSIYFHKRVIDLLHKDGLSDALKNELFFEYLYATLASWGLHRMGETNTKLLDFDNFKKSITSHKEKILVLRDKKITELTTNTPVANQLQKLIENLKIGVGEIKLIFNSKAIHHFLPDLMPPIDRQHTLLFFYNSKNPAHIDNCFTEIFPKFVEIAIQNKNNIRKRIGKGFHTSETKVIDNAIVGYVRKNLMSKR